MFTIQIHTPLHRTLYHGLYPTVRSIVSLIAINQFSAVCRSLAGREKRSALPVHTTIRGLELCARLRVLQFRMVDKRPFEPRIHLAFTSFSADYSHSIPSQQPSCPLRMISLPKPHPPKSPFTLLPTSTASPICTATRCSTPSRRLYIRPSTTL